MTGIVQRELHQKKKRKMFASSIALKADFEGCLKIYFTPSTGDLSNYRACALLMTCSSIGLSRAFEYLFLENVTTTTETPLICSWTLTDIWMLYKCH